METPLHPALTSSGRFEVRHCLGSGGFGVVYAAYDRASDANVAIKWLRNSEASTIARFKREFRALADIVHPNLVGFRELLTVDGEWFFTMDLVNGVDLLRWVRPASPRGDAQAPTGPTDSTLGADALGSTVAQRSLVPGSAPRSGEPDPIEGSRPLSAADLPRLRATLEQLGEGLAALHRAGMLHRDVKPSNVLVTREGRVVLLDFGLVTEMGHDGVATTLTGNIVGTPGYMSPEQALGKPLTPASDWYAVGTIVFHALTGRLPFEGETHGILLRKQLADPPAVADLVRGVPRALSELAADLLSRAPERRPDGAEFLERLRAMKPVATAGSLVPPARPSGGAPAHELPLVGRDTHLWALEEALEEVERGATVVALVHGTSGMGKTSLVRHFLDSVRAERPEVVIVEGRCYERESVPYKALDSLVDSLCRFIQRLPEVEAAKLLPRDVGALARVFPVFLQFEGAAGKRGRSRLDAVQERRRAFEALRELLARVADRRPLVLFIDDLQWGDGDSEPLLLAVLKPPDPPPLLLIAAYRSDDAAASPLVRALRKLVASGPPLEVCEIPVGELSPDAARDLAASLLGSAAEARAEELARESFGSPLFLKQLAALGASTGEVVDLATALQKRVAGLPPEARRLLETLAVSGRPLPLVVAARGAGIEEDAQGVLAKLRAEMLVRTRGAEAQDEVEVYHDRIREVIVASLSEEELKARHHRLARALSSAGDPDAEALATHFRAAGDRALAATYAEQAAERAEGALAFGRAAEMYEMALELASSAGSGSGNLVLKLAEALVNAGRGSEAAVRFLWVARRSSATDALELKRRAAEQLLFSGRIEDGLRVIDKILSAMKMRGASTRLGAVLSLLFRRFLLFVRGLRYKERSHDAIAREELVRIDTCFSLGLGLGMVDPVRGADFQTRYLLLALRAGEPLRIARGLALEAAYRAGDGVRMKPVVDALLTKASALAERVGQPHARALTALMSGVSRVLFGEFDEGVALCDRASAELREKCTGVAWELDNAAFFASFSLLQCGRIRELAERVPSLLDEARARGDLYGEVLIRLQCAWFVKLASDDPSGAEEDLAVITDEWSRDKFLLQHAWRMINEVEVALYSGDGERAWSIVDDAWPGLRSSMFLRAQTMRVRARNVRARAALASGRLDVAVRDARDIAREDWPHARGWAELIEASVAAERGDRAVAIEKLRAAIEKLRASGARLYAWSAELRLGHLLGGDEGTALESRAAEAMAAERIAEPSKMAGVYAPGRAWSSSAPAEDLDEDAEEEPDDPQ